MPLKMYQEQLKKTRRIAIAAGKGGVGKSTVTVHLARALKKLGFSVGILDVDVYGPSIRHMLPEEKMPRQQGEWIEPGESFGIKCVSIAFFRKKFEAVAVRAPIANGIITQFLRQVNWGDLDFLLMDFPPGTGDVQLTMSQQAQLTGAVMVTTPQEVALLDVKKAIHLFDQCRVPILGVVENMSYFETSAKRVYPFGQGGGEKLAGEIKSPLLGEIGLDPEISRASDAGEALQGGSGDLFVQLAKNFLEAVETVEQPSFVKRIFQRDKHTLSIEWGDGEVSHFCLRELQKRCPCAGCANGAPEVAEEVEAAQLTPVGRYAVRVHFTSGCSAGIYEFTYLRELEGVKV